MQPPQSRPRIAPRLVTGVLAQASALADELVCRIAAQNAGYRRVGAVPERDLWRSCHDNLTQVLELLRDESLDDADNGRFEAARATGRRRAEQQMPLDDVLRSFRLGGRLVWEALIEESRELHGVDADALLDVGTRVWEVVDAVSAQVAISYHDAERSRVRADEQHRATLWEGLLAGRAADPGFAEEVSRVLGIPVRGWYAVVVADAGGSAAGPEQLPARLRAVGVGSVWQSRSAMLLGLLALPAADASTALPVLAANLTTSAGVSLVVSELAEVGAGYRQALLARRALPARGAPTVATLAERLPEALLLATPELTAELVRRWLGPLVELPAVEGRLLLDTLEAWVQTAGSTTRTAAAAHCHRNTVDNRLRRIESLTGVDVRGAPPLELSLALRAWRLLLHSPLA